MVISYYERSQNDEICFLILLLFFVGLFLLRTSYQSYLIQKRRSSIIVSDNNNNPFSKELSQEKEWKNLRCTTKRYDFIDCCDLFIYVEKGG